LSYRPRSYQTPFWQTFSPILADWRTAPVKRGILVWHRRAGKDLTAINFAEKAMQMRSGTYYHFLPTYTQAKKIVWNGHDREGRPFMANFNPKLIASKHETELKITYHPTQYAPNGSTYQLIGGEQIDSIVGTNPVGCIFSEYPLMSPRSWDLVRPILRENGGWALFIFTPRGKNHAWDLWNGVKDDPEWFRSTLSVDDTRRDGEGEDGGPVMTRADVESEIRAGMSRELAAQEFYCSFEGALEGAYYADQMMEADKQKRITKVEWDRALPVDTAWDFGLDDETAIWFTQTVSEHELRVIEYIEGSNVSLEEWIKELRRRPYQYGTHWAPHDIKVRDYTTGNTRLQFAQKRGIHFEVVPKLLVEDGIDAGRRVLPVSWFDAELCNLGISALKSYHRDKDEKLGTFKKQPVHDWSSHAADAWRTRAVAWRGAEGQSSVNASFRYHLHKKHEEATQVEADTSWKRNQPEDARGQVEVDDGGEWWKD